MLEFIDSILNKVTMYRLVFYELIGLLFAAGMLGIFHLVPYDPLHLAFSTVVIFGIAWSVNELFAAVFRAPSNPESTYITALILALIISPPHSYFDTSFLALAWWGTSIAVGSKYILAIGKKHIFNPAAFGVAATALVLSQGASWWIGTLWMLPFVGIGGLLVVRKIRRFDLVIAFVAAATVTILALGIKDGSGALHVLEESLFYAPLLFLGTVMLTEPLTAPTTRVRRILYGVFVGFLFAPQVHIGTFYFTPELALLAGNVFAYLVSSKTKLVLTLKERIKLAEGTYEFIFTPNRPLVYEAGQYLEWTLAHANPDRRGIRRYFTISSAPGDTYIRLGVRVYEPSSTFKRALIAMNPGETIIASQLTGDFTLPKNPKRKLVFIAGGIGITPFSSMLRHLLGEKERRDIRIFYANRSIPDAAYVELLDRAEKDLAIETEPIFTEQNTGDTFARIIDVALIKTQLPDYLDRTFYLSGPHAMVTTYSDLLRELGVSERHIRRDYFPGFA